MNNANELRPGREYYFNIDICTKPLIQLRVYEIKYIFERSLFGSKPTHYILFVRSGGFFTCTMYAGGNEIDLTPKQASRLCQDAIEVEILIERAKRKLSCAVINDHINETLPCNRFHPCNACTCVMPGGAA